MAKTAKKTTSKKPATAPKKDRHATPVIVTASGKVVAGKRRINAYLKESDSKVVIRELHHYAMLPFLRVARDDDGRLHLTTTTRADEEGWTLSGEEVRHEA